MSLQYNKGLRYTIILLVILTFTLSQVVITSSDNKTTGTSNQIDNTSLIEGSIIVKIDNEEKLTLTPKINITDNQKITLFTNRSEENNIVDNILRIKIENQGDYPIDEERYIHAMFLLYRGKIDSIFDINLFQDKINQKIFYDYQKVNISNQNNLDIPISFETPHEQENATLFVFLITKPTSIHFLKNPFFDFSKNNIEFAFNSSFVDTTPPITKCKIEKK